MKKNSAKRKLIPAAAMLCISAAMLATSTYAWFTMNKEVSAVGMQVQARAEAGLLISEVKATTGIWDSQATANALPGTKLIPTSTKDGAKWVHANSTALDDEAGAASNSLSDNLSADGYTELSLKASQTTATSGSQAENNVYYADADNDSTFDNDENAYYVMYKYYLKVSDTSDTTLGTTANAQNLAIKSVTYNVTGTQQSPDLNKALRVGIAIGEKMYIYAPVYGSSEAIASYYVTDTYTPADTTNNTAASVTNTQVNALTGNAKTNTTLASLPAMDKEGTEVDVYVWYEGEDDNCQSDKITSTLDNITVSVTFALETLGEDATDPANNAFATS